MENDSRDTTNSLPSHSVQPSSDNRFAELSIIAFQDHNHTVRSNERIKSLNLLSHIVHDNKKTLERKKPVNNYAMVNTNIYLDSGHKQILPGLKTQMAKYMKLVVEFINRKSHIVDMEQCIGNKISQNIIMNYYSNCDENASLDNIPVFVLEFGQKEANNKRSSPIIPSTSGSEQKNAVHYDIHQTESPSISLPGTEPYPSDLGIGSLVEVVLEPHQVFYGVIRWIDVPDADADTIAGIELEEEQAGQTDETYGDERFFVCPPGRRLFVPLSFCRKDGRFQDVPATPQPDTSHIDFGQMDCPVVPGCIPPLNHTKDLEKLCGKFRGIQGHHNSCYLDATLFSMFMFTSIFDSLLFRPPDSKDCEHYEEVQQVLREEIVNPLRHNRYVRADRVMKLRKLLEKLSSVSGLTSEEKDPEEFLNSLVAQILRAEPFLKLNSGQEAYHYQLFVEKDEKLSLPSVQQLFEQSFLTSNIKLKEVPPCLIIQMPRFGKSFKMYPRILPSQLLDVTDVIEDAPRQCTICGKLASFECKECYGQSAGVTGLESTAFCQPCLDKAHLHVKRANHKPTVLSVPSDFTIMAEHCLVPRLYMELFAVVCIETSHYVAFVKAGSGQEAPWCFFDSMADRKGEQNGYNIPEIILIDDISTWLSEEGVRQLHEANPKDKMLPEHAKRLLCDAYMCMYQSPDVSMYR